MRYYSGGLGQRFVAIPSPLGWTWLLGYNASIIASDDVHLLTTMFNSTTPARTLLQKYNTRCESANVAVPSNTDRTTAIQLVIYSMRHASSDSIFMSPNPMVA